MNVLPFYSQPGLSYWLKAAETNREAIKVTFLALSLLSMAAAVAVACWGNTLYPSLFRHLPSRVLATTLLTSCCVLSTVIFFALQNVQATRTKKPAQIRDVELLETKKSLIPCGTLPSPETLSVQPKPDKVELIESERGKKVKAMLGSLNEVLQATDLKIVSCKYQKEDYFVRNRRKDLILAFGHHAAKHEQDSLAYFDQWHGNEDDLTLPFDTMCARKFASKADANNIQGMICLNKKTNQLHITSHCLNVKNIEKCYYLSIQTANHLCFASSVIDLPEGAVVYLFENHNRFIRLSLSN